MNNFSAITRKEQVTFNEYEVRFVLDQHAQLGLQPPMQSVLLTLITTNVGSSNLTQML
jgi:hypothetical protein